MSREELVGMLVAESIPIHDDYLESIFPTPTSVIVRHQFHYPHASAEKPLHRQFSLSLSFSGLSPAVLT
jgi:hypothetical protein